MKTLTIYLFLFAFFLVYPRISDSQIKASPYACPLEKLLVPYAVHVGKGIEISAGELTGIKKDRWQSLNTDNAIGWNFEASKDPFKPGESSVIRRIKLNIISKDTNAPIKIKFSWIPFSKEWGIQSGYLSIIPDGKPYCYSIQNESGIPMNVDQKEFVLEFPKNSSIKELAFSDYSQEYKFKTCPMPKLEGEIQKALDENKKAPNDEKKADVFVKLFEKALPTYDCMRDYDSSPVPAWWLSNNGELWINHLSNLKTKKAKKLYGSSSLRNTLDGEIAEIHLEKSLQVEKELKK